MSLPAASAIPTPIAVDDDLSPFVGGGLERALNWDEPHPGVPMPLQEGSGTPASGGLPSEAYRGDMAAKGYGYFKYKTGVARRYARPTMRPHLKRSETSYSARRAQLGTAPSAAEPTPSPHESSVDLTPDTDMGDPLTPSTLCDLRPHSLDLGPVSRITDLAPQGKCSNASSVTVLELGPNPGAAPSADLYGWEAELNRKLQGTSPYHSPVVCPLFGNDEGEQRCHTGHKRNLFQRVWSLGDVRHRSE
jgi:hypothetical protein